jgi:hypothetical protein
LLEVWDFTGIFSMVYPLPKMPDVKGSKMSDAVVRCRWQHHNAFTSTAWSYHTCKRLDGNRKPLKRVDGILFDQPNLLSHIVSLPHDGLYYSQADGCWMHK